MAALADGVITQRRGRARCSCRGLSHFRVSTQNRKLRNHTSRRLRSALLLRARSLPGSEAASAMTLQQPGSAARGGAAAAGSLSASGFRGGALAGRGVITRRGSVARSSGTCCLRHHFAPLGLRALPAGPGCGSARSAPGSVTAPSLPPARSAQRFPPAQRQPEPRLPLFPGTAWSSLSPAEPEPGLSHCERCARGPQPSLTLAQRGWL